MKFTFTPWRTIREGYKGVHLGYNLYLSSYICRKLNYAPYLGISYDHKSKALMIVGAEKRGKGYYKATYRSVTTHHKEMGGGSIGALALNRMMPRGRYFYVEDTKDGVICVKN